MNIIENIFSAKFSEDFYNIDNKPSYTLKKCLEKKSNKLLDYIYFNYHFITKNENYLVKNISRKCKINFLLNNLPKIFEEKFNEIISIDNKIFDDTLIYKTTPLYNDTLLTNGFMYKFNDRYVVPREFLNIYLDNFSYKSKKIATLKTCCEYMDAYLYMNGIIDKKILYEFMLKYKLEVTMDDLETLAKNKKIVIYKNYYSILKGNVDYLIKVKEEKPYCFLNSNKLLSYLDFFNNFIDELTKVTDKKALITILNSISSLENTVNMIIDNFSVSDEDRLSNLLSENWNKFRFWVLNGKTFLTFRNELIFDNFILNKKCLGLKECLDSISKKNFNNLINLYEFSPNINTNTLSQLIINNFKMNITRYSYSYLLFLIACNNSIIKSEYLDYFDFTNLYIFVYKCGKNNRIVIPKEIISIAKKHYKNFRNGNIVEN